MSYPNPSIQPTLPASTKPSLGKRILRKWPYAAVAVVGITIGAAAAGAGASERAAAPAPEPEVVTETVEVEVADPTCRDAAEELHTLLQQQVAITSELSTAAADAMNGAASFDIAAIEAATADVNALSARQEQQTTTYTTEVAPLLDECRAD